MERELRYLGEALDKPKRPFVAVLGGAKISGKIDLIEALLPKVDQILIGGAMACTFFRAMGLETGNSLVEEDRVEHGARSSCRRPGRSWCCPRGAVIAQELEAGVGDAGGRARCHSRRLGHVRHRSRHRGGLRRRASTRAGTVVWNGPMGVFETPPFDHGTLAVAGQWRRRPRWEPSPWSAAATRRLRLREAGLADQMTHVSTGGGRRSSSSRARCCRESLHWTTREPAPDLRRELENASRPGRRRGVRAPLSRACAAAPGTRPLVLSAGSVDRRDGGRLRRARRHQRRRAERALGAEGRLHWRDLGCEW